MPVDNTVNVNPDIQNAKLMFSALSSEKIDFSRYTLIRDDKFATPGTKELISTFRKVKNFSLEGIFIAIARLFKCVLSEKETIFNLAHEFAQVNEDMNKEEMNKIFSKNADGSNQLTLTIENFREFACAISKYLGNNESHLIQNESVKIRKKKDTQRRVQEEQNRMAERIQCEKLEKSTLEKHNENLSIVDELLTSVQDSESSDKVFRALTYYLELINPESYINLPEDELLKLKQVQMDGIISNLGRADQSNENASINKFMENLVQVDVKNKDFEVYKQERSSLRKEYELVIKKHKKEIEEKKLKAELEKEAIKKAKIEMENVNIIVIDLILNSFSGEHKKEALNWYNEYSSLISIHAKHTNDENSSIRKKLRDKADALEMNAFDSAKKGTKHATKDVISSKFEIIFKNIDAIIQK